MLFMMFQAGLPTRSADVSIAHLSGVHGRDSLSLNYVILEMRTMPQHASVMYDSEIRDCQKDGSLVHYSQKSPVFPNCVFNLHKVWHSVTEWTSSELVFMIKPIHQNLPAFASSDAFAKEKVTGLTLPPCHIERHPKRCRVDLEIALEDRGPWGTEGPLLDWVRGSSCGDPTWLWVNECIRNRQMHGFTRSMDHFIPSKGGSMLRTFIKSLVNLLSHSIGRSGVGLRAALHRPSDITQPPCLRTCLYAVVHLGIVRVRDHGAQCPGR